MRALEPNPATAWAVKRQTHILVCFALNTEAAPFRKIGPSRPEVSILITGVGRGSADKAVRSFLADHSPDRVFTCGFAGGLNPALAAGDVVFETDDPVLRNLLPKAGAKPARCFCALRIAVTAAEKQALRRTTGADVVEMESEVIQAICRERSVPCATLRAVSDPADEDLPLDFNELMTPARGMNYCKLMAALLKSPAKIRPLLKLQRRCAAAAEALAKVLARVTSS